MANLSNVSTASLSAEYAWVIEGIRGYIIYIQERRYSRLPAEIRPYVPWCIACGWRTCGRESGTGPDSPSSSHSASWIAEWDISLLIHVLHLTSRAESIVYETLCKEMNSVGMREVLHDKSWCLFGFLLTVSFRPCLVKGPVCSD